MSIKPLIPLLFAFASSVLLALSLPPYDFSGLAWFALVPMLMASSKRRPLEAAGLGLVVGATCGLIHARWSGGAALIFAWLPFLWFGMLCALASVAFRGATEKVENPLRRVFYVACVGVVGEWLTTLTPLPINFAVTQHRVLDLIQIADVTGIWGVSFLLWFANAAIANAIMNRNQTRKWQTAPLFVGAALVSMSFAYSRFKLGEPHTTSLRVAAVQAFESNGTNGFADAFASSLEPRENLTRKAVSRGAQLVVWSEEVLGNDFQPDKNDDATRQLARGLKTTIVAGFAEMPIQQQWNSAALISPTGKVLSVHRKIHLYAGEKNTTTAGTTPTVVSTALGKVGIAICFDTCWTNVLRDEAKSGAQIIAMPNFDPPVPRGVVHYLHGAMLPFRAIENRVPIVRADPNGQSGTIDANGRVLDALPMWKAGASISDVHLGNGKPTFFAQTGDWLAWLCVAVATLGTIVWWRRAGVGRGQVPK